MGVIGAVAVQRLRRRWRAWSALVLLTGLAGGAVLAAAAGARRTESAFPRFLRATAAADVVVSPAKSGVGGFDFAIGSLPGVQLIAPLVGLNCLPLSANGTIDEAAEVAAPLDGRLGHLLQRPRLLAGRQPRPNRPGEVMVDQIAAAQLGLHVGSPLRLAALSNSTGRVRHLTVRVVGIEVTADSIVPVNKLAQTAYIQASQALYRQLGPDYQAFDGDYVRLAPGTTVTAFTKEATSLADGPTYRRPVGGQLFVADESVQDATAERSIRPQAVALGIFALVLALTALLVLGQAATRLLLAGSADNPVLSALGLTRRQLFAASLLEVVVSSAIGALLACIIAVAASPLMPIGSAGLAELHPGISADWTLLVAGFGAIVLTLAARVGWTAWRQASIKRDTVVGPTATGYGSRVAGWLARSGAPATTVTGVRLALQPSRGRAGAPMHGALVGTALSVAAFMASSTFGANLTHLERTPHLYGQNWDAAIDLQFGTISPRSFGALVAKAPGLKSWTFGLHGTVVLSGHGVVPAIALAQGKGPLVTPTMLAGHVPAAGQIVLGSLTMQQSHLKLGQEIDVSASSRTERATVVGRAIFPYFGQGSFTPTDLGLGALVPTNMLAGQAAQFSSSGWNFVLVRFAPGQHVAADIAAFKRLTAKFCASVQQSSCVVVNQQPNGLIDYSRIDATPLILASMLGVLGLGVLAQFTFQSARARRRDFAIFKTLGMRRRQLTAIASWQISTISAVALVVGLPVGSLAGRWAWALFADVLGISPGTGAPITLGLLVIPCVLVAANLVALGPARRSIRLHPADLLRAE